MSLASSIAFTFMFVFHFTIRDISGILHLNMWLNFSKLLAVVTPFNSSDFQACLFDLFDFFFCLFFDALTP